MTDAENHKSEKVVFDTLEQFLSALSLEGVRFVGPEPVLGEGQWDARTGGGLSVRSELAFKMKGAVLTTEYVSLSPAGYQQKSKLFEIEILLNGKNAEIESFFVLGREIPSAQKELIWRGLGAVQAVHASLRNLEFPLIAKILNDFHLSELLGEALYVPGQNEEGEYNFWAVRDELEKPVKKKLSLPKDHVRELLGLGSQSIDPIYRFDEFKEKTGFDQQNGEAFSFTVQTDRHENRFHLSAEIKSLKGGGKILPFTKIICREWRDQVLFDEFIMLGEDVLQFSVPEQQKRLGILLATLHQLRQKHYPQILDHLVNFGMHHLITKSHIDSDIDEHQKMIVKVYGGHNDNEFFPGLGATIGGNCRGVFSSWRDERGITENCGIVFDLGSLFTKQKGIYAGEYGTWDIAFPDITADLSSIDSIFITHLHADHMQGVIDYARAGLLCDKKIYGNKLCMRVLSVLLKQGRVPSENWPELMALEGDGLVHIVKNDRRALSIYYNVGAHSHSTDPTDYIVMPPPYRVDKKGRIVGRRPVKNPHFWTLANFGDMSFPQYNLPDYAKEKPALPDYDPKFFSKFYQLFEKEYPKLTSPKKYRKIDEVLCDVTSVHREGFAPDVVEVNRSFARLNKWFSDKGLFIPHISTAIRQQRGLMEFAVDSGRSMTVGGAYMEQRFTDMNIVGVHPFFKGTQERNNINIYLSWLAEQKEKPPVKYLSRSSKALHEFLKNTPEKLIFFATGSQNTDIEQESWGTKIAQRASLLQRDPKFRPTAYGVDLDNFVILYAQGAIPGNEESQLQQVMTTAYDLDVMVGLSVHRGTRFFNLKEPYREEILEDLETQGDVYTLHPDGSLTLHDFPLYPPGHGWGEDYRQGFLPWFKENNVQSISAQHYDRVESVQRLYALADEQGLAHMNDLIDLGTSYTRSNGNSQVEIIGRHAPSFILAREHKEYGKFHGLWTEYLRAVFVGDGFSNSYNGLQTEQKRALFSIFANTDWEEGMHQNRSKPDKKRTEPDDMQFKKMPKTEVHDIQPLRGIQLPPCFATRPRGLEAVS